MKNPEVENMRMKVIRRMLMMFVLGVFVVLTALHRVDVLRVDPKGIFGTILLVECLLLLRLVN